MKQSKKILLSVKAMQLKKFQSTYSWGLTSWNAAGQHFKAWTIKVLWTEADYMDWFYFKAISEVSPQFSNFTCEQESIFFSTLGLKFADQALNQGVLFKGHWIWSTAGL